MNENKQSIAIGQAVNEHDSSTRAKRVVSPSLATKVDEADASTTYIGTAVIGAATSSALWQIKKVSVSGTVTTITWADGNDNYDNIWDNRASLSYS